MKVCAVLAVLLFVISVLTCFLGVHHDIQQIPPEQRAQMADFDWVGVRWIAVGLVLLAMAVVSFAIAGVIYLTRRSPKVDGPPLAERFLLAHDYSPERTWSLLEWCLILGASEFTVSRLFPREQNTAFLDRVERELDSFRLPTERREHLTAFAGKPLVRSTNLWSLTPASLALLKTYFDAGLFTYPASETKDDAWLEDPLFYRDGHLVLGIVSHEHEGVVRLTKAEHDEAKTLGFVSHDKGEWL
jgi:hypothetical protein